MFRGFLFSLLITGLSCVLQEYRYEDSDEYRYLQNRRPVFRPYTSSPFLSRLPEDAIVRVGDKVTVPLPIKITRDGADGLLFTIMEKSRYAVHEYLCDEGTLSTSWFKFEFKSAKTLLTIHLGNVDRPYSTTEVEIVASVYFSHRQSVSGLVEYLSDSNPASVGDIVDFMNQESRKEKTAKLSIDWIANLFIAEQPVLLYPVTENENGEKLVKYLCKPILAKKDVLEKLLELKDHLDKVMRLRISNSA